MTSDQVERLPRARGDRPQMPSLNAFVPQTAPRTRGSTPSPAYHVTGAEDCPAHAGIDLSLYRPDAQTGRLPRARGDRPSTPPMGISGPRTAPRTRGSTASNVLRKRA